MTQSSSLTWCLRCSMSTPEVEFWLSTPRRKERSRRLKRRRSRIKIYKRMKTTKSRSSRTKSSWSGGRWGRGGRGAEYRETIQLRGRDLCACGLWGDQQVCVHPPPRVTVQEEPFLDPSLHRFLQEDHQPNEVTMDLLPDFNFGSDVWVLDQRLNEQPSDERHQREGGLHLDRKVIEQFYPWAKQRDQLDYDQVQWAT